jgi:ABC-2 type transport system ATP-binding protein
LETILQLHQLHKKYGKVHAVNDLSFTIKKGNVYGILGPNGSGKSTTLGIILNVVNATSGSFSWFDGSMNTHEALKKVGAIIERPNFYPFMTAAQNLELVCKIKGIDTDRIDEKLEIVHLFERRDSKFKTFSLGMKQRLAIASALLNDPEILILDEPTNGLDPQGIQEIRRIITDIAATGTTILLASHLLDEVEKVCSHVIVLRNGKKLYEGLTHEMSHSFGVIEIKAANPDLLKSTLQSFDGIGTIRQERGLFLANLTKEVTAEDINQYLFNKGIVVSHLLKRKPTLEQQFLDLTNKI